VLGGYETLHVGVKDGKWRFSARRILMVAAAVDQPDVPETGNIRYRFHEHPTRRAVMWAVARACRYPTFLLRGDAGLVVRYLAARKGRKLSAMTGRFRNGKAGAVIPDPTLHT